MNAFLQCHRKDSNCSRYLGRQRVVARRSNAVPQSSRTIVYQRRPLVPEWCESNRSSLACKRCVSPCSQRLLVACYSEQYPDNEMYWSTVPCWKFSTSMLTTVFYFPSNPGRFHWCRWALTDWENSVNSVLDWSRRIRRRNRWDTERRMFSGRGRPWWT